MGKPQTVFRENARAAIVHSKVCLHVTIIVKMLITSVGRCVEIWASVGIFG